METDPTPGPVRAPARRVRLDPPTETEQATPEQVAGVPAPAAPLPASPGPAGVPQPPQGLTPRVPLAPVNFPLNERLAARTERNARVFAELASFGAAIQPGEIQELRIGMLLDVLWPMEDARNQRRRLEYELAVADRLGELVEPLVAQVRQLRLAEGATLSPEALQEMAGQVGIQVPGARRTRG